MRTFYLLLSILFLSLSLTYAQNPDVQWNMREKERLLESIKQGDAYQGVIKPRYDFEFHQLLPAPDTVTYIRLTNYDSIVCKYTNNQPENVVQYIFRDLQDRQAKACTTQPRLMINGLDQSLVGHKNGELVTAVRLGMDQYGLIHTAEKKPKKFDKNLIPVAVIDDATLTLDQASNELFIKKNQQKIPVNFKSGDLLTNSRVRNNMVKTNEGNFFLPVKSEGKMGIGRLNAKNGETEIFLKTAILNGFSDKYIYFTTPDGFTRAKLKNKKQEVLISPAFFELMEMPPFITPNQDDDMFYLSISKGQIALLHKDFFKEMNIDFNKYMELSKSVEALNENFKKEGIYPWDYGGAAQEVEGAVAMAEVEEVVEVEAAEETEAVAEVEEMEQAVAVEEEAAAEVEAEEMNDPGTDAKDVYKAPKLTAEQEKRVKQFFKLNDELRREKRKIRNEFKVIWKTSEHIEFGYVPRDYQLGQHPVNKTILFVHKNADLPILYADDILMLDKDKY